MSNRRAIETPVALMVYARPDTTRQVLAEVRAARPERLLVVADAPPAADPEVAERCAAVREIVENEIDWPCDVSSNFAERHMGLKRRVETGLDWVFDNVDEAIVLEDDCIPHPTFFPFCAEMLERYRADPRVMTVSGTSFAPGLPRSTDGYRFSRYPLIWGWATWRRAWQRNDPAMSRWPELRDSQWLEDIFADRHAVAYWWHLFEETYSEGSTWDYAWVLSSWVNGGLSVIPDVNLVTNVGFRPDATHTTADGLFANMPVQPISFPLAHPPSVARDAEADQVIENVAFSGNVHRMFARLRGALRMEHA